MLYVRRSGAGVPSGVVLLLVALPAWLEAQSACGHQAIANEQAIYYCVRGTGGPSVILAAGTGQTSRSFDALARQLSDHTTTLTFDRPGMGNSESGPAPRSPSVIAAELRKLLERVGVPRPWILVGHSSGGWQMLRLAALAPDAVRAAVLLDTPPVGFEERRMQLLSPEGQAARREMLAAANDRAPPIVRQEREAAPSDLSRGFDDFPRQVSLYVLAADAQDFGAGPRNDAHRALWVAMSREWGRLSDRGTVRVVEGSGHMVHLDAPELVRRVVEAIVREAAPVQGLRSTADGVPASINQFFIGRELQASVSCCVERPGFQVDARLETSSVKKLSFIDQGLWGFEVSDADRYVIAFFRLRDEEGERPG